jgi:KipI family sensor histidine kinase inhibitor
MNLSPDEVVEIFSSEAYLLYFLGFLCALVYLGGVSSRLNVPRLASPRPFIPEGSVGTAGGQANIIPVDLPSGFNYLGRTFVKVYDPRRLPPTLMRHGDYVQFPSVSEAEAKAAATRDLEDFVESL